MSVPELVTMYNECIRLSENNELAPIVSVLYIVAILGIPRWEEIDTAPHDRTIWVFAPPRENLPAMFTQCAWNEDAGFCIDELRSPILWWHNQ